MSFDGWFVSWKFMVNLVWRFICFRNWFGQTIDVSWLSVLQNRHEVIENILFIFVYYSKRAGIICVYIFSSHCRTITVSGTTMYTWHRFWWEHLANMEGSSELHRVLPLHSHTVRMCSRHWSSQEANTFFSFRDPPSAGQPSMQVYSVRQSLRQ